MSDAKRGTYFDFQPCDFVVIVFCGVNYNGRVSKCHLAPAGDCTYTVEYVDDAGAMKSGDFRGDEIEDRK